MALSVDITKRLGKFFLNVSFETEGCIMGILGKSGCGISMTLKCIAGIEKPDTGRIVLDGKVFFDSEKHINLTPQKRSVGYLFQNYALFPGMTVEENIAVTMKGSKAERAEQVRKELERFGLSGLEKQYPGELSGGQAQRVALARMLVTKPSIILLDEPFSALDTLTKTSMHRWYLEVMEHIRLSTLFITHDIDEAIILSDRICLLTGQPGHITAEITITQPRPRPEDFNLTPEFLAYKKDILEKL